MIGVANLDGSGGGTSRPAAPRSTTRRDRPRRRRGTRLLGQQRGRRRERIAYAEPTAAAAGKSTPRGATAELDTGSRSTRPTRGSTGRTRTGPSPTPISTAAAAPTSTSPGRRSGPVSTRGRRSTRSAGGSSGPGTTDRSPYDPVFSSAALDAIAADPTWRRRGRTEEFTEGLAVDPTARRLYWASTRIHQPQRRHLLRRARRQRRPQAQHLGGLDHRRELPDPAQSAARDRGAETDRADRAATAVPDLRRRHLGREPAAGAGLSDAAQLQLPVAEGRPAGRGRDQIEHRRRRQPRRRLRLPGDRDQRRRLDRADERRAVRLLPDRAEGDGGPRGLGQGRQGAAEADLPGGRRTLRRPAPPRIEAAAAQGAIVGPQEAEAPEPARHLRRKVVLGPRRDHQDRQGQAQQTREIAPARRQTATASRRRWAAAASPAEPSSSSSRRNRSRVTDDEMAPAGHGAGGLLRSPRDPGLGARRRRGVLDEPRRGADLLLQPRRQRSRQSRPDRRDQLGADQPRAGPGRWQSLLHERRHGGHLLGLPRRQRRRPDQHRPGRPRGAGRDRGRPGRRQGLLERPRPGSDRLREPERRRGRDPQHHRGDDRRTEPACARPRRRPALLGELQTRVAEGLLREPEWDRRRRPLEIASPQQRDGGGAGPPLGTGLLERPQRHDRIVGTGRQRHRETQSPRSDHAGRDAVDRDRPADQQGLLDRGTGEIDNLVREPERWWWGRHANHGREHQIPQQRCDPARAGGNRAADDQRTAHRAIDAHLLPGRLGARCPRLTLLPGAAIVRLPVAEGRHTDRRLHPADPHSDECRLLLLPGDCDELRRLERPDERRGERRVRERGRGPSGHREEGESATSHALPWCRALPGHDQPDRLPPPPRNGDGEGHEIQRLGEILDRGRGEAGGPREIEGGRADRPGVQPEPQTQGLPHRLRHRPPNDPAQGSEEEAEETAALARLLRLALVEFALEDLAGRVARQLVEELELAGRLVGGEVRLDVALEVVV